MFFRVNFLLVMNIIIVYRSYFLCLDFFKPDSTYIASPYFLLLVIHRFRFYDFFAIISNYGHIHLAYYCLFYLRSSNHFSSYNAEHYFGKFFLSFIIIFDSLVFGLSPLLDSSLWIISLLYSIILMNKCQLNNLSQVIS